MHRVLWLGVAGVAALAAGWVFLGGTIAADPSGPAPQSAKVVDASKYPSLQAALDAVPEVGGLVKLPPGEFRIESPLVLARANTRVEGCGAATRIVNCCAAGQPTFVVRPANLGEDPKARIWRVQLADFRLVGDPQAIDGKSGKPASGDGLLAENADELYVHGLSIDHHGGSGIHLVNCYEDPRIADSILTYNAKAGLWIDGGHDIVVSANHFEENGDGVRCLDSFNLTMTGNNLDDHLGNGVVIENTYGSVVSGNMIEECQGAAVVLGRDCYGITISANVIADNFGGGVDLRDAWGCTVSANTFTITAVYSIRIGPESGRIVIAGNNFSDSYIGGTRKRQDKLNEATGIVLEGTSDIAISGNVFAGLAGPAIRADAKCSRIAATGNLMTDLNRRSTGKERLGAMDLGGARPLVADHNLAE